ncbi:MAG: PAS domain S-box protein [Candidatus Hermodarchaeota archaeon]
MDLAALLEREDIPNEVKAIIRRNIEINEESQKKLESHLERVEIYDNFKESAPDSFFLFDSDLKLIDINLSGIQGFPEGTQRKDIIGMHLTEIVPGIEKTERYARYLEVLQTGIPVAIHEYPIHSSSGEQYFSSRAFKVKDGLGVISTEITDLKIAEKELMKSQERFKEVLARSPVGMAISSLDGDITYLNNKFIEITGYTLEDIPTFDHWWPLAYPDEEYRKQVAKSWFEAVKQARVTGSDIDPQQWKVTCKDGSVKDIEFHTTPIGNISISILVDITEKKHAEVSLKESRERFWRLFVEAPFPLMEFDLSEVKNYLDLLKEKKIIDLEQYLEKMPNEMEKLAKLVKLTDINDAALRLFEVNSKEEWTFPEVSGGVYPFFQNALITLYSGQTTFEMYTSAFTKKKKQIFSLFKALVVPGFEETLAKVYLSGIDITELKLIEENLRQNEAEFRRLFEDAPFPLMEFDLSDFLSGLNQLKRKEIKNLKEYFSKHPELVSDLADTIILKQANHAALRLFELENVAQWSLQDVGGTQFPFFTEVVEGLINGLTDMELEGKGKSVKEREFTALMRILAVPGFEQTLSKVFVAIIDITNIKKMERALVQSELKFRSFIMQSNDGIILTDEKGLLVEWNKTMEGLSGITRDNALGKPIWVVHDSLMPKYLQQPDVRKQRQARITDALKTGKGEWLLRPIEIELINRINQQHRFVQANSFPINIHEGFILGSVWRDITEQKRFEDKMKHEILKFSIEDRTLYLIKEADPLLSIEVLKDLIRIGYLGLICSRTPENEYREIIEDDHKFVWLSETALEKEFSSIFEKIESSVVSMPPKSIILIDRLDYLIQTYGFKETLLFIYRLRELALLFGFIILLSIDEKTITDYEVLLLEKETKEVETRVIAKLSEDLLEILRFVYSNNNIGVQPSYTQVAYDLDISRPTARKRIKQLTAAGYLRENQKGRQKVLELTLKGLNSFIQK